MSIFLDLRINYILDFFFNFSDFRFLDLIFSLLEHQDLEITKFQNFDDSARIELNFFFF